jgi:hypothetical protein
LEQESQNENSGLNAFDSVCTVAEGHREVEGSVSPGNSGFLNFAARDSGNGVETQLV